MRFKVLDYDGGYAWVRNPRTGRKQRRYRVVWEMAHGTVDGPYRIVHKDKDKLNDKLENLELRFSHRHPKLRAWAQELLGRPVTHDSVEEADARVCARWNASEDLGIYGMWEYLVSLLFYEYGFMHATVALKYIRKAGLKVESILDHGCGTGSGAFLFETTVPGALIVGSNSAGVQLDYNRFIKERIRSEVVFVEESELEGYGHFDVLCGFELFEHFKEPVAELRELVSRHSPNVIFEASSFSVGDLPGHYKEFLVDDEVVSGKKMMSRFATEITNLGYHQVTNEEAGFIIWNHRPRVFVREGAI